MIRASGCSEFEFQNPPGKLEGRGASALRKLFGQSCIAEMWQDLGFGRGQSMGRLVADPMGEGIAGGFAESCNEVADFRAALNQSVN